MPSINIIAMLVQEGGKIVSELIRIRPRHTQRVENTQSPKAAQAAPISPTSQPSAPVSQPSQPSAQVSEPRPAEQEIGPNKATAIETGCVPCSLGHVGTCSGLMNEAVRFVHKDGMGPEVFDRLNMCLDELNTMERVDLRPQMIENLVGWEKELAVEVLKESRSLRHSIEAVSTADDLEHLAAKTQQVRQEIGRQWFSEKLDHMPEVSPDTKAKVLAKLDNQNKA